MDTQSFVAEIEKLLNTIMPVSADSMIALLFLIQVVVFLVGLVRLFMKDYRIHGLINIGNSILYALGIFLIDNRYMPIAGMVLFVAVAITLGILNLTEGHYFDIQSLLISLGVYIAIIATAIGVAFLVSKERTMVFFTGLSFMQWEYAALLVCWGIPHLFVLVWVICLFWAGSNTLSSPDNNDPINGATGNEDVSK